MAKQLKENAARKPPEPLASHAELDKWMGNQIPSLQPIVKRLDGLIRESIPGLQFGIKWKKAYYGLPELGWVIELAAYDVSANVVFLGGAAFNDAPKLGSGQSRYVKVRSLADVEAPELRGWLAQAGRVPGWK